MGAPGRAGQAPWFAALSLALALGAPGVDPALGGEGGAPPALLPPPEWPADLSLVDLEGRTWTPGALAGRVVALDFWATWCSPCVRERARLAELRKTHPATSLVILSVNLDHADRRSLVAWLNRHRIAWPQVHEPLGWAGPLARRFRVSSLPWTVVYGANGRLLGASEGLRVLEDALGE